MSESSPSPSDPSQEPLFDRGPLSQHPKNVRRRTGPPIKLILGSLALLTAIILFLGFNKPSPEPAPTAVTPLEPITETTASTPAAPVTPSGPVKVAPRTVPPLGPRTQVGLPNVSSFELPIYTDTASMDRITKSVQLHQRRPSPDLVRTEDLLNSYDLHPTGPTGISRGVTVSTESISCPWKPSSVLFIVSIRGAAEADHLVSVAFKPALVNVARYRILGFETSAQPGFSAKKPTLLRAKTTSTWAIEIDPSISASELGSIEWSVDNQPVPPVALSHRSDLDPSDDTRFAALICAYSQWLARERPDLVDDQVVAALAREIAAGTLTPERTELLNLIDRSLHF